jgi:DNA-binding GntR family transcriptional regulator
MAGVYAAEEVSDKFSLRGRVFNIIRENILAGVYKHNEALKETKISEELGVSRTPVREAIKQLELEGLVMIIPNKGAVVSSIGAGDIEDIYAIRSRIEGLAARWATEKITDEQIETLEEILYLSRFHLNKGHIEQLYELDTKFHELIYEISGSRIIKHILKDFHNYVKRVRLASLSSLERAEKSVQEHEAILEAITRRDFDAVEKLTNEHVERTKRNLIDKQVVQLLKIEN